MKTSISLEANIREKFGTSISRNLRSNNKIPAVIYGENEKNDNIALNEYEINKKFKNADIYSSLIELNLEGNKQQVIIKDIQRHQYKNRILHIDFQRVTDDSLISTKIPIHFTHLKECIGVKYGGKINMKMSDIKIICKARDLPKSLVINLSKLDINQNLQMSDVENKGNIVFLDQKKGFNRVIVSVKKPKKQIDKKESKDTAEKEINNTKDEISNK